jgi:hypothetical protein
MELYLHCPYTFMTYTGTTLLLCLYFVTSCMEIRDVYVCMLVLCKAACGNTVYVQQHDIALVKVATGLCNTAKMVTSNAILDASLSTQDFP